MKKTIITLMLLFCANFQAQAKLFAILNITPEEFIACNGKGDDPRCRASIQMGCNSFCYGQSNENSALQNACRNLCKQTTTTPIVYKPDKNESEE